MFYCSAFRAPVSLQYKKNAMKKTVGFIWFCVFLFICVYSINANAQTRVVKKGAKYDTIIVKHGPKPAKKPVAKPAAKPALIQEIVLPTPEFINQPYYYDNNGNKLIKLENANALMATKKKTLGLKGAKQSLSMDDPSSKIRFVSKKDIVFFY